jgi:DNA-binding Xre family transcriptional regulator
MMKLKIKDIAIKRGIKNARQLADISHVSVTSCYQLWNGTAKMISFDVMNTLCNVLQAGPHLLFDYTPDIGPKASEPQSSEATGRRSSGSSAKSRRESKQSQAAVTAG